jgi:mono/diheme cytochrome c family protein
VVHRSDGRIICSSAVTSIDRPDARAGLVAASLLLVLASAAWPAAHEPITTKVTFAREIRAILADRCVVCHAPGGSAPMPLTTYDEVRPWARGIKEQVLTRRMPRWHAARGFGAFRNDPTLTPLEMSLIVSWVDGGLPRGPQGSEGAVRSAARGKIGAPALIVPPGAAQAMAGVPAHWVSGWSFEPGDPLIVSATISSDAGVVGTWVAGDGAVTLPAGTAMRVRGKMRADVQRRPPADFEQPFSPRRSVLRLAIQEAAPERRAWTQTSSCAAAQGTGAARVIAVRPVLGAGQAARIAIARTGAPATIVGWFRSFDPSYPRTYWLSRPVEFGADARLTADAPCEVSLTLTSR